MHVEVGAFRRQPLFRKLELADLVFELVAQHPETIAACLMPDRLHWLLSDAQYMLDAVRRLKSHSTTVAWHRGHPGRLWQQSFRDHILGQDADLSKVARNIIEKPVREGLAQEAQRYPYHLIRPERVLR